jgi:hypothetical protein
VETTPEGHRRFAHSSKATGGANGGHSELDYDVIVAAHTLRLSALNTMQSAICSPHEVLLTLNLSLETLSPAPSTENVTSQRTTSGVPLNQARAPDPFHSAYALLARARADIEELRVARFVVEDPGVCTSSGIAEGEPIYRRVVRVDGLDEAEDLLPRSAEEIKARQRLDAAGAEPSSSDAGETGTGYHASRAPRPSTH